MEMTSKMKQKVKNIEELYNKIKCWNIYEEYELENIIKQFEKIPRYEMSAYFKPYFTRELVNNLLEIGKTNNKNILCNIVSILGNMITRYNIEAEDRIFDYFVSLKDRKKKVNYYVSMFLPNFPQFKKWENKWDYLITIPEIAPKKKSMDNFYIKINSIIKENEIIPIEYKEKIITLFEQFIDKNELSIYTKDLYDEVINKLKDNGVRANGV
jgi:hypothetical protein